MFADLIECGKENWGLVEFGACEGDGSSPSGNGACLDEGYTPWAMYDTQSMMNFQHGDQDLHQRPQL